jgi:uncharacterized protein involved in response to NO
MPVLRQLLAAPHRVMFATGMFALVASALWWTLQLAARSMDLGLPVPVLPVSWLHAVLFLYGPFPAFIFGFLMTTFARWQDAPEASRPGFSVAALLLAGGQVLVYPAMYLDALWVGVALGLTALGLLLGWLVLLRMWLHATRRVGHATAALLAVMLGALGAVAAAVWALSAEYLLLEMAIALALWGFLLPVYFAVGHRMVPFFSSVVIADYEIFRPAWSLPVALVLCAGHLGLALAHRLDLTWLVDLPLALLAWRHTIGWQPLKARGVRLLLSLHLGFAWFGVALGLYAAQSLALWAGFDWQLGRMPLHALALGMFGSLLVAMVTRVTMGHSGRPLVMDAVAWTCFLGVQSVVLLRLGAELLGGAVQSQVLLLAATLWAITLLVWAARCLPIYLSPRADGKPG